MVLDPNPHRYQICGAAPLIDPLKAQGHWKGYFLFLRSLFKTLFIRIIFKQKKVKLFKICTEGFQKLEYKPMPVYTDISLGEKKGGWSIVP